MFNSIKLTSVYFYFVRKCQIATTRDPMVTAISRIRPATLLTGMALKISMLSQETIVKLTLNNQTFLNKLLFIRQGYTALIRVRTMLGTISVTAKLTTKQKPRRRKSRLKFMK